MNQILIIMSKKNKPYTIKQGFNDLKKFWNFIWNDDSLLSWVLNIIVAIVMIKFIIYPVLGLLLSTGFPIVAVISGSMEHAYAPMSIVNEDQVLYKFCNDQYLRNDRIINFRDFRNFDDFWIACGKFYEDKDITKEEFKEFSFKNGFNTGDIMILYGTKPEDLKIGDIIVFQSDAKPDPIIHRIIGKWEEGGKYHFKTKGDHNVGIGDKIQENDIIEDRIIARAVIRIPYLGWVKIWAFNAVTKIVSIFN